MLNTAGDYYSLISTLFSLAKQYATQTMTTKWQKIKHEHLQEVVEFMEISQKYILQKRTVTCKGLMNAKKIVTEPEQLSSNKAIKGFLPTPRQEN